MKRTLSIAFAVAAFVALPGCSSSADMAVAEKEVSRFHLMLDAGQYDQIYDGLFSAELKKTAAKQTVVSFLGSVHDKLGAVKSTSDNGWSMNYATGGEHIVLKYVTTFVGGSADERFDFQMDSGQLLLAGYHITPRAPGAK